MTNRRCDVLLSLSVVKESSHIGLQTQVPLTFLTVNSGLRGTCPMTRSVRELRKSDLRNVMNRRTRAASADAARVWRRTARDDLFGHLVSVLTPDGFAGGLLARDQSEVL